MMKNTLSTNAAIRTANPVPPGEEVSATNTRAQQDLDRILRQARQQTPTDHPLSKPLRISYGHLVVAAVVVLGVVAAGVFQPWSNTGRGGGAAYAATPPALTFPQQPGPPAAKALHQLATHVRALPRQSIPDVIYIKTQGWYLNFRDAGASGRSGIEGTTTEEWISRGSEVTSRTGGIVDQGSSTVMWPNTTFSSDPTTLCNQLSQGHPIEKIGVPELFVAIGDLYREANPDPGVRAAILDLLSREKRVTTDGTMTDRVGRQGVGFSVNTAYSGLPERLTLIFDQQSGALLDSEEMLTKTAGALNVQIPAVTAYTTFLQTDSATPPPIPSQ